MAVTDGQANGIPRAALHAIGKNIPIYTIGLCIGNNHALRNYSASYRAADSSADLAAALEETLAEAPSFDVADFESLADSSP